jgi:hypothetical protein
MGRFSPSPEFLRHATAVVMQRNEDDAYLAHAIISGRAVRGNARYPKAIFINGEGPMIDLVAVRRLREMNKT